MAGFREGLWQGSDGLEFDVYVTKDVHPVLIHDNELVINEEGGKDRNWDMINQDWESGNTVAESTLAELRGKKFGHGYAIVSLEELVGAVKFENKIRFSFGRPHVQLNVELKGKRSGAVAARTLVAAHNMEKNNPSPSFSTQDVLFVAGNWKELEHALTVMETAFPGLNRAIGEGPGISPQLWTSMLWPEENIDPHYAVTPRERPQKADFIELLMTMHAGNDTAKGESLQLVSGRDCLDLPFKDINFGKASHPQVFHAIQFLGICVQLFLGKKESVAIAERDKNAQEVLRWILAMPKLVRVRIVLDEPSIIRNRLEEMITASDTRRKTELPPEIGLTSEEDHLSLQHILPRRMHLNPERADTWRSAVRAVISNRSSSGLR